MPSGSSATSESLRGRELGLTPGRSISACRGNWRQPSPASLSLSLLDPCLRVPANDADRRSKIARVKRALEKCIWHMAHMVWLHRWMQRRLLQPPCLLRTLAHNPRSSPSKVTVSTERFVAPAKVHREWLILPSRRESTL